jgi:hypothetical protein
MKPSKELQDLITEDQVMITPASPKVVHFEFTGTDEDTINVPLCGELSKRKIITKSLQSFRNAKGNKQPCPDCLAKLNALTSQEDASYEKSKGLVKRTDVGRKGRIPVPARDGRWDIELIDEVETEEDEAGKRVTKKDAKGKPVMRLKDEDLVPVEEQILGSDKRTFWRNVVLHGLVELDESSPDPDPLPQVEDPA